MPTYNIRKNTYNEWVAKTEVPFGGDSRRLLVVRTSKNSRKQVQTNASVVEVSESGDCHTHAMFKDFSITVSISPAKRVTQSIVEAAHKEADLVSIMEQAKAFYAVEV